MMQRIARLMMAFSLLLGMIPFGVGQAQAAAPSRVSDTSPDEASVLERGMGASILPAWFDASRMYGPQPAPVSFPRLETSNPRPPLRPLQGSASCVDASLLDMQITPPPYIISRGNTAGDVYTVTVTNNASQDVTEFSFLIDPNVGFYYLDNSATVTSSDDDVIPYSDTGTGAPDASATISSTGAVTQTTLAAGETLTLTFELATNGDAKSGQRLEVKLQSGSPTVAACKTAAQNLQTARGNLVVTKSPTLQDARVGDTVTWTVELRNSGLGNVYSATLTDTPGAGLANLNITPPPSEVDLAPEETRAYEVTAVVSACKNLTNTVAASWPTGNADGTGTGDNPVRQGVDVVLLLDTPEVEVEVGALPGVNYCGALDTTIPVTVTNTGGGMARELRLNLSASGVNVGVPTGWSRSGDVFTYVGGSPFSDAIGAGETIMFSLPITTANVCESTNASVSFTPVFELTCLGTDAQGTAIAPAQTVLAPSAPTLNVSKSGEPYTAIAGDSFTYIVDVSGDYQENIGAGGITVVDTVADQLVIDNYTPSTGSIVRDGQTLTWTLPVNETGAYTEQLTIDVTVPTDAVCNASDSVQNTVTAFADVCPSCSLTTTTASNVTYVMDVLSPTLNTFNLSASPVQLCAPSAMQLVTASLSVGSGITWTGSIYTDTLGREALLKPLDVDTSTLQVLIDGVDRTSDVSATLVTAPLADAALTLDFSNIGTFSPTANISITYQVSAQPGSIPDDAAAINPFLFAAFKLNGPASACDGDLVGYVGTDWTIERGDLNVAAAPATLDSCQENTITLTVSGAEADTLTDNVVVTFTAQAGDVFTPTNPTLGGAFAGEPLTVTAAGEVVTFTFASDLELDGEGTISFPLWRACGNDGALSAAVSYQDLCDTPRSASDTGGETSRVSNVHLFATPQDATVNERETRWRFYVYNTDSLPATPIITNMLPAGYVFYTYTVASATAPGILDSITLVTNTVGGNQILTFTIPGLAQDEQVQFDVYANIESQCAPVSPVKIKLKQACGQVGGVCGDSPNSERVVEFASGRASINSSNDQTTGLPLCEVGTVQLLVKNTSPQSQVFDFTITEIITNGSFVADTTRVTVTNRSGDVVTGATTGELLQNIPFTPTVATVGNTQILTWTVGDFAPGNPAYDVLAQRESGDLILLTFGLQTGCEGLEAQAQSGGAARDVCNNTFGFDEDSQTLVVDAPELRVVKSGCNDTVNDCSDAGNFTEEVFAGADEVVIWKIDVFNDGPQDALNLYVDDVIPANFTINETNPISTSRLGDTVSWEITNTTTALAADGGQETFYITGTVDTNGCVDSALITVTAGFGCTSDGISCSSADVSDIATLRNEPAITLDARDLSISQCGGGPVRVLVTNDGAYAKDFVISYTLPISIVYKGDDGSSPSPDVYPALGATGTITWRYATLTQTAELRFNVENQAGVCPGAGTLEGTADGRYLDSCDVAFDDIDADDATIRVRAPSIEGNLTGGAAQLPITRVVTAGEVVTWVISLRNSGSWPAHARNVVITETFGTGYESIAGSVSTGSGGGSGVTPVVAGQTITWDVGTLNAGGEFSAIITATVLDAPDQLRLTLEAHSECDNGECSWDMSPAYYATALQDFTKTASVSDIPIGQPFSYTITADFFGDYTYTDLVLTDTLPTLDGQLVFSVTEVVTANANSANVWQVGSLAGPQLVFDTASGDVTGPETITLTITGVVSNSAAADNGDILNNAIALAYTDDTPRYLFAESEPVTVIEPALNIGKTTSASGPVEAGDRVTYTLEVSHTPASTADAYDLELTDVIPDDLTLVPGSLQSNPAADSVVTTSQSITLTYQAFPLASDPLVITYVVTVDLNAEPSSNLFNNAQVLWTSTETDPFGEERTGEGSVDDYIADVQTPVETGDPEIIKYLLGPTEYTIGDLITYTAEMSLPAGRARDVVLSDTLPTGLVYQAGSSELTGPGISASDAPPTFTVNGPNDGDGDTTLRWELGTLTSTPGSRVPIVLTFTVALTDVGANQRGDTRNNDIEAAWLNDQDDTVTGSDPDDSADEDTITIIEPVLNIAKTVEVHPGDPLRAGSVMTYLLTVANTGDSPAYNWVVTDSLPSYLAFVATQGFAVTDPVTAVLTDTNAGGATDLAWEGSQLNVGGYAYITFTVETVVDPQGNDIVNVAGGTYDNQPGEFPGERDYTIPEIDHTTTPPSADVMIVKQDLMDPALAGTQLTYTLAITNNGPDGATGIVVTDSLPSEVVFVSASSTPASGPNPLVWNISDLASGASTVMTLYVMVKEEVSGTLTNTAAVTAREADPDTDNNDVDEMTTVIRQTDLEILKTSTPTPAIPGEAITYTILVTNTGPITVTGAKVTDTFPSELNSVSWTCEASTGSSCASGAQPGDINDTVNILAGGRLTYTVQATVDPDFTGTLENTAVITPTDAIDSDPDNNEADDNNPTSPETDLSLSKTSAPNPAIPGEAITYTLVVTNAGSSTLFALTLTDDLPAEIQSPNYAPSAGSYDEATGAWMGLSLSAGQQAMLTITGTVDPDFTGTLQNTAIVTPTDATDPNPGDNAADDSNPVSPEVDLALSKTSAPTPAPTPAVPGEAITYTLVVTNAGPSTAFAITLTDDLPDEIQSPNYAPSAGSYDEATGAWTGLSLRTGDEVTLIITGTLDATFTGTLQNTAIVTPTDATERNPDDNHDDDSNPVSPEVDLALTKSSAPNPAIPGAAITYTLVVANAGPSTIFAITLTDDLPDEIQDPNYDPSAGSYDEATGAWTNLNFGAGDQITLTIVSTLDATFTGTLQNTAIVTPTDATERDPDDNADTDTNDVQPTADLALDKMSRPVPVVPGEAITYTLVVANAGPSLLTAITLTDDLPPVVQSAVYTPSVGSYVEATGAWTNLNFGAGDQITLTIVGTLDATFTGTLQNTAVVTPTGATDPDLDNNKGNDTNSTNPEADFALTKTSAPLPAVPGEVITYTLVVANAGPSTIFALTLTDDLPDEIQGPNYDPSAGSYDETTGAWTGLSLGAGDEVTLIITGTLDATFTGTLRNTAIVTSMDVIDPNPGNNDADDSNPVSPEVDLALSKTSEPVPVVPGEAITYTLVVTNAGPSTIFALTLTDDLPDAIQNPSYDPGAGIYDQDTGAWTNLSLDAGDKITLTIVGTLDETFTWTLQNTAVVTPTDATERNPDDNDDDDSNPASPEADLALSKSSAPAPAVPGAAITYTLVVTNAGPSLLTAITLTDDLPNEIQSPNYFPSMGDYNETTGAWTGLTLGGDETITLTIVGALDATFTGTLQNTAIVTPANATERDPGDNEDDDSNPTRPEADLALSKTSEPVPAVPTEAITYTLVVANAGPSTLSAITLTDDLPDAIQSPNYTPSMGDYEETTGVWTGLSLSAGDQITLTIVGTLDATFTGTLQNTAIVTPSGATDPNPNDNEDDDSNTSRHKADLALTKTSAPNPAIPGEAITYTLVVANAGPNAISAITLTDDLPDAIQSPNYTPSMGDYEETTGVWTGLSLSAGDQITLTIVGALDATFTGTLQNTAFVTPTDAIDPDPDNNEDDDSNPASPEVDLALSKTSAPRPAVPGAAITYTLVVTNAGPSTIFAITLTDDLPDEIQSPHYDPSVGSYDEATGAWTNLNFDAGDQITLTIVGTLDATFTGTLQNTAIVTPTDATERDPGDNEDDDSNPTRPEADLALSKTSAPNPAIPGEVITYTLVVANAGPSTAFALTLTDDLPDAIRGPAYTSSAGSYDETTGAWTGLSLGAGEIITLTIAGTLDATFTGTLQNTAIVTPTGVIDPNPDNNDAADNNPVSPQADLVLSKTASDATPDVGDEIAFTIVVTNAGPSAATGIEVMDQLPSGYTYVDAWASVGSYTVTTGWWMIGDLAVDATATLIVTATVNATGDYTNAAEVIEVDQDDPTSTPGDGEGDDYDETTPTPNLVADLGVDKRSAPRPYEIGGPITYTLVVTNAGPSAITALTLTDNLPAEILTPTYAASAGSYEPSTGAWIGFALNVGERVTLTITGVVDPNFIGVLQNTATVTTPQAIDPTPSNNESTDTNPASALLAATKHDVLVDDVDGNGFAGPGETLSYTVIISNIGASAATGVFFSDTLDVNTALITGSVRTSWGAVMMGNAPGDASVIVDLGVVAAGAVITIEFQARIDDPLPDDVTVLANQGWISSNELPDVPTDDPDTPEEGDPTETPIDLTCPVVADDYEPDDFYDLATDIATDGTVISRTFHIVADKDWARFYGWAGRAYTITTLNLSADVDTVVQLYVGDDATLLWENDDYRADSAASQIVWEATEDGWYYVRVTHFDRTYDPTASLICGNAYQLMVEMAPCGIDVDAYEPDDHFTAAVSRPVDGQPITRSFETLADKDWISFDAVAGRTYTITTSRLGGAVDTVLQLYDTDGKTLIDENDDYLAASDASQIVWTAARSGKYYVRITHFDPTYDPAEAPVCGNGYQVAVETALCDVAGDAYEPDDHFTAAAWRPAEGQPITRSFETLADKDWISFDAVAGRIYTITTSHLGGAVDTVLQLYDTDGKTLIDENDDYLSDSKASQIVWRAGKNGKYFVRITHFDPTYDPAEALVCGNDYRVAVATAICELSDPYEPDDHYVSAVAMPTSGELIQRRFVRVSDKDWFVFPVLAGEMYTITTSHLDVDVDTVIQLYDGDGRTLLLHNDDYMPESRASRIVWVAPRDGEVYVRVTHFDHTYDPRYSQVCGGGYALAVEQDTIGIDKWGEDVNGAPTLAGDIIEYTVVVWNKMNLSQTNVVLTDAIPMHTTYITNSARVNLGALSGPDPLVVRAPELDIGGRITLTFQVRMTRDARGQTILNYARVKSDQQIKETASPLAATQVLYQLFLPIITRSQ